MRIALSIGMNREIPPGYLDATECEHRRRLWWTVYVIDRRLSMNTSCPSSIRDEDIDLSLPSSDFQKISGLGLALHVKLAALTGKVTR
jgi:proline utilization trans-activator